MRGLRARLRHLPLRLTLVAALLLLVGGGLLASVGSVTTSLETSLMRRLDSQLVEASRGWAQPDARPLPPLDEPNPGRPPSNFFVRSVATDGTVRGPINDVANDGPDLSGPPSAIPKTVGSEGDPSKQWRVITVTNSAGSTTVGMSLSANQMTVGRLVVLQFYIGAAVLLALGVMADFVVRRSLRPLREVETTAAAIAAGDLHRRVPEWSEKTEVGRLSAALNGMLSQIQRAFAATAASEEAARASEDRMRRFVADASHELRTPLTTIRGFAELYRQGAMSDISLLMTRIEGESARMGLLVEDLLMLARLDAQRPLDMRRVDVLTIAADAVHDATAISPGRDITLKVMAEQGIPEVIGDDPRLRQVVANLVGNAVRHTPDTASITVCVETTRSSVLLDVQDTGPGLSEDEAAHVFERFYRADSSRTRESGGSGLGLSIVAALVAAHRGTVSVQSVPGKGARFRVELPRADG